MDALEQLVREYRQPLMGYLVNMSGDPHEAEEVFQETWLRVTKHISRFDGQHFKAWLFRIARNYFLDARRKKRPHYSLDDPYQEEGPSLYERMPDSTPRPDEQQAARELGARIRAAVTHLPPEQKEVFTLRTEAGLSFKEIAELQATSINTALARMQYAMKKLQADLHDDYEALTGGTS